MAGGALTDSGPAARWTLMAIHPLPSLSSIQRFPAQAVHVLPAKSLLSQHQLPAPCHPKAVTVRKDDAPAAVQAAIDNVAGSSSISAGGGLIQTTSG
jgi:hypothetical protein